MLDRARPGSRHFVQYNIKL